MMSAEKFGRCKTEVEGRTEIRERLALKNKLKSEKRLEIPGIQGIMRRDRNENRLCTVRWTS